MTLVHSWAKMAGVVEKLVLTLQPLKHNNIYAWFLCFKLYRCCKREGMRRPHPVPHFMKAGANIDNPYFSLLNHPSFGKVVFLNLNLFTLYVLAPPKPRATLSCRLSSSWTWFMFANIACNLHNKDAHYMERPSLVIWGELLRWDPRVVNTFCVLQTFDYNENFAGIPTAS